MKGGPESEKLDPPPKSEEKKCIGRWGLTALIMNSVIGAGIFGLPSNIAHFVGSFALWAYVFGAAMTAVIVTVIVELSSQFKKSGGAYCYVTEAFGLGLGIQTGCFSFLARTTTAAAIANLLMTSLAHFWPEFANHSLRCVGLILIVGTLAAINIYSTKSGILASSTLLVLKLLPLVVLVVAGLLHWNRGSSPQGPNVAPSWNAWADALIAMVFAFSGFESAMIPAGDIKDPLRNTGPAAFGALALIFILYLSLHLVIMRAVPSLASSEHSLSDAAAVYLGGAGQTLMAMAAIVSTLGWLSAAALSAPRLTEQMANDKVLPEMFAWKRPKSDTPWVSIVLWAMLVIALALYGTFFWNVVLSVAARLVVYSTMCISVPKLRKEHPEHAAWRTPFGIAIPAAGILICTLLATRLNVDHILLILGVAIAGIAIWLISCRSKAKANASSAQRQTP